MTWIFKYSIDGKFSFKLNPSQKIKFSDKPSYPEELIFKKKNKVFRKSKLILEKSNFYDTKVTRILKAGFK